MSKYEELIQKARDANAKKQTGKRDDYEAGVLAEYAADREIRAFERAAAGLIERAREVLEIHAQCCRARCCVATCEECNNCGFSGQCKTKVILAEMEAL